MIQDQLSALAALFDQNQEWAREIARKVSRKLPPSFDIEDLEQIATIAMWKLCERYDPQNEKGTPFQAFARKWVEGAVLMHCRRRNWKENTHEPLDGAMVSRLPDPETGLDMRREEMAESRLANRQRLKVKLAIEDLQALDAYLVTRRYLDGMEVEELAALVGMEPKELGKRLSRAVRQLKKAVGVSSLNGKVANNCNG